MVHIHYVLIMYFSNLEVEARMCCVRSIERLAQATRADLQTVVPNWRVPVRD